MAEPAPRLDSVDMARFVSRGFLRRDAVVPEALNRRFLAAAEARSLPVVPPGVPLSDAYPASEVLGEIVRLPAVRGLIESLVGPDPIFDHHFLHLALTARSLATRGIAHVAQPNHQDSTIDTRLDFDLQLLYFPHEVDADMGGTRFLPGSHLRLVSEAAIGRYQNFRGQQHVVCPAGSVFAFHHGIWHGAGLNRADRTRLMFKVRLQPRVAQRRLWDLATLPEGHDVQQPIFFVRERRPEDDLHAILCTPEPWFEADTARLEFMNRIRLWRFLLGDERADADYWLTRVERAPSRDSTGRAR